MNIITDRKFLWFEDRFYCIKKEEVLKAYEEGANLHPKIHAAIVSGNEEVWLPSSTTILGAAPKPWLADWRGSLGNVEADRVRDNALAKGSRIHEAINIWTNGGLVIYNNPRKPSFTVEEIQELTKDKKYIILQDQQEHLETYRLIQWFNEVQPTVIATEFTVVSLEHGYAGTGDLLIHIKDGTNYFRQVASYSQAIEENRQYEIAGGLIIHTNDNKIKGGIEGLKTYHIDKPGIEKSFDEFLKIKAVYDLDLDYQPKVIELPAVLSKDFAPAAEAVSAEKEALKKPAPEKKNGKAKSDMTVKKEKLGKPIVNSVFDEE
jgi:hypothetical protein